CLNVATWEVYGDNHKGYAVGFHTLELARQIPCTTGLVTYSDAPFPYSFLGKHEEVDILLYKKTSWAYEQEFRFITVGIGYYMDRLINVTPDAVAEVVLGYAVSSDDENEIIRETQNRYGNSLPIFKTQLDGLGKLLKQQIR